MTVTIIYPFLSSNYGGSFRSGILLAKDLPDQFEPLFVFPEEGESTSLVEDYGLEYKILDLESDRVTQIRQAGKKNFLAQVRTGFSFLPYTNEARRFIRESDADLIHTNDLRTTVVWGLAAKLARRPLVWHVRRENASPVWDTLRLLLTDHAICVSQSTADSLGPFPQLTSHSVVYNGVDLDRFNQPKGKLRAELGVPDSSKIIAYIGYLTPRKRPMLFARGAIEVLSNNSTVHAVMMGSDEGEYEKKITELAVDKNVSDRFHLLGYRDDVEQLLPDIDTVVMTSTEDGEAFPRVVIEAMASGTPVVSTRSAGVVEAILHGETGYVVPSDVTPGQLANQISNLLRDDELLQEFSSNARTRAVEQFSNEELSKQVVEVYERVVS